MRLGNLRQRLLDNLRVLPVLVVASGVLFGFKLEAVRSDVVQLAFAADAGAEEKAAADGKAAAAKPAETAKAPPAAAAAEPPRQARRAFSEQEIELLQGLAKRRDELDSRGRELDTREALLQAAEKRMDEKIAELKQLEARVAALVQRREDEQERQLRSLVKVYEAMKPKDAARIFDDLQPDVLLGVAERMKEQRIAPILAEMEPGKAKDLTVRLATRRDLPPPAPAAAQGG